MNTTDKISCLCSDTVFKSIFELNFKLLRNYLAYKYKDIESANDVAQNAFVILWENCNVLNPEQAKSFLFTTSNRLFLNQIRKNNTALKFQKNANAADFNNETPEFVIESKELKNQLETAINSLPEKQREVFCLSRFENQTYAEIATLLGLSVKAVEKRMHLALLTLRKVMKNI